ncbi:hypothetical protein J1605_022327 [Eschrichtius robustus]|uniref:Glucoside xylosyltransferase 1 n=1 Tax=Eschrichtius robustus TaxID=9764 RepID=A0AB34H7Z9_ESCRO|nr:hypothetical protein J1605_022327 [Eschrichtius robustus]
MRRYLRVVVLCLACGFCSLLYAFSQLAVSLEEGAGGGGGKPQAAAASWLAGGGRGAGRGAGSAGPAAHPGRSDSPNSLGLCSLDRRRIACLTDIFIPELFSELPDCVSSCTVVIFALLTWSGSSHLPSSGFRVLAHDGLPTRRYSLKMQPVERVHLAVVACGERLEETLTMLKSALIFSIKPLQFHIFAEDQLHDSFKGILILKEVDSLLYVDTDILFLRPVDDIWSLLKKFNSTQIAAMAPEHEEPRIGWYNRFARHPYYGKTGVNSGVMLMNMTRMRRKYFKNDMTTVRLRWGDILMPLLKKYKLNITWGDQDLLNIIFFHNPDEGVYSVVCSEVTCCSFEDDNIHSLLKPLELELQKTVHTYCGKIYKIFIKQLTKSIQDLYDRPPKER